MKKLLSILFVFILLVSCQNKNEKVTSLEEKSQNIETSKEPLTSNVDLSMYPKAKNGYKRVYIQLSKQENEHNYKLEIYVGTNAEVDTCNGHGLVGELSEKIVDNYGYTYYEVQSEGHMISTLMKCDDDTTEIQTVYMEPYLTHYNSQLPIVIYIPNEFVVKYKIYASGELMDAITKN